MIRKDPGGLILLPSGLLWNGADVVADFLKTPKTVLGAIDEVSTHQIPERWLPPQILLLHPFRHQNQFDWACTCLT